jgi:thioredoxin reductase (NADPH)
LQNPNIHVRFNSAVKEIRGNQGKLSSVVLFKTGTELDASPYEENADAVFIFVGTVPQTSLVSDNLKVETDEAGYIITDGRMASSVPGLFAAGDVRASPFRQVVTAAGEGAVAAHCAAAYIDNLKGEAY